MVVDEVARDVVVGAACVAPEGQEVSEAVVWVEGPVARERDAGGNGDEGRLVGWLVTVVGVPEVEGELGEGQDAEAGVEGRGDNGDVAAEEGLAGLVVEHAVEGRGGNGAVGAGLGRCGGGGGAEDE